MLNKYLQNTVSQSVRNPGNQIVGNSPKLWGGGGGVYWNSGLSTPSKVSLYTIVPLSIVLLSMVLVTLSQLCLKILYGKFQK